MYVGTYYSTSSFTISGSGDVTEEFHPGREVEYATITGSTTYSGIYTPDVTNSGVTVSGSVISGSVTNDYYAYYYGIIETTMYFDSDWDLSEYGLPTIYSGTNIVGLTPESDEVPSGTLYIKYGAGQVGLDTTFPSTSNSGTIYKLGHLNEFVGYKVVDSTVSRDKLSIGNFTGTGHIGVDNASINDINSGTWFSNGGIGSTVSVDSVVSTRCRWDSDNALEVKITHSGSSGAETDVVSGELSGDGSITLEYNTTASAGEYVKVRPYQKGAENTTYSVDLNTQRSSE